MTLCYYKSIKIVIPFLFSVFLALSVLTSLILVVNATPEDDFEECEANPNLFGCPGGGAEGDAGDSSSSEDPLQSQQQQQTSISLQQAQSFLTFEHPVHEYTIQYPSDWQKIEEEDQVRFIAPHKPGDENIEAVTIGGISRATTLGSFAASTMREISLSSNDFSLVESEETNVGGRDAIKRIYTSTTEDGREVKAMKNFLVINGIGVEISYYAAEDEYQDSLAEAESMIDSFQLIKRDAPASSTGSSIQVQEQQQQQSPDTESQFSNKFGLDGSQNVNIENGVSYPIKYRITDGQVTGLKLERTSDGKSSLFTDIVTEATEADNGKLLLEIPNTVLDPNSKLAVFDEYGLAQWKKLAQDPQAVVLEVDFSVSFDTPEPKTIEIVGQQSQPQPSPQPSPDSSTPEQSSLTGIRTPLTWEETVATHNNQVWDHHNRHQPQKTF